MAKERDIDAVERAEDEPRGLQCGERLAAARAEREVSVTDIAKELHISEDKVEALERNDFDTLGAAVFARGYIRKYAQLVGLKKPGWWPSTRAWPAIRVSCRCSRRVRGPVARCRPARGSY